jgi:hypothetical protein
MKIPKQLKANPTGIRILYREKIGGGLVSVAHTGIEFSYHSGESYVLHRTPDNHSHISSPEEFSAGEVVTSKEIVINENFQVIERANLILDKNDTYSPFFNNCEHLQSFVLKGEAKSEQLKSLLIGGGLTYLLCETALKDQPGWVKGLVVLGGGLAALHLEKKSKLKDGQLNRFK